MKFASCVFVFVFAVSLAHPAISQTIPKDTCSVLSQADLDAVLGKGAKAEPKPALVEAGKRIAARIK